MTNYQKAFESAQDEIKDAEIIKLKEYFKQILQKIEQKKLEIEKKQEELRILKLDLEDLKAGKLDKIKERQDLSPTAKSLAELPRWITTSNDIKNFSGFGNQEWFTGTYNLNLYSSTGQAFNKTIYF